MSWHRVLITNPAMAQRAMDDLLQQWRAINQAAGRPTEAMVYRDPTAADAVWYFSPTASILATDILWVFGATVSPPPNLDVLENVEVGGRQLILWWAKEATMAQAIVVILKADNERQVFQNAIAETADNQLRIYRQADPRGLAERQLVAEFDLNDVQSWFAMADAPREPHYFLANV